ncbi:uncharacterized protein LOC122654875 [Telopea speciosissima]|uniref:uncharacterized protein LOC122654875 n=1 Tax=Telopea speciosissima TaxID=54955 RepID=UPI001CC45CC5|nr:uncharacterized protein LOC122654875 [Telopea speciosissima]
MICFLQENSCDICGVNGYSEALVVCSRCQQACEHVYCMRKNLRGVPAIWFCEACRLQTKSNSEARSDPVKIRSPLQKPIAPILRNSNWKGVETARVKPISAEEVIMLASGTKRKAVISSTSQPGPTDGMRSTSRRTPPVSESLSKHFFQRQNATSKKVAVRTQPPCGDRIPYNKPSLGENATSKKVAVQTQPPCGDRIPYNKPSLGENATSKKVAVQTQPPCGDRIPYNKPSLGEKLELSKVEEPAHLVGEASSLIDSQYQKSVQGKDLAVFSPRFEEDHENLPALDCTWKGSFEIVNMSSGSHFYDGFRAHPPGKVSRKAYEFSKKMSGILQFKLQNHSDVWAEVFNSYSPSGCDIALYFFPGDFERSIKMYNALYAYLEMHDFAMRSCLEGVELLIFTSKQLPLDSRINMEFYLWGVFHHVKGNNVRHPADVPLSSSQLLPGDLHGYNAHSLKYENKDKPEVVDMDIDMEGGKDVGRVDVVRHIFLILLLDFLDQ